MSLPQNRTANARAATTIWGPAQPTTVSGQLCEMNTLLDQSAWKSHLISRRGAADQGGSA
eukprot:2991054-Rhodomonas_salina.1